MLLLVCVLVATVTADVTHTTLKSGQCLCVHGGGVNARDHPGTSGTTVKATLNTGECYKFYGGELTLGAYKWFEITVSGQRLWVAGVYLNVGTTAQCASTGTGSGSCGDTQVKAWACELLQLHNSGKIELWKVHPSGVHDNAFSYNNIRDTCNGHAASRSHYTCNGCLAPGGTICLNHDLVHYLITLARKGYMHVNEIAGACHTCNSRHYRGQAVDLHNGSRSKEFLDLCFSMNGWGQNEGDHIHCQFGY
ncbi:uncharacterized protein [Haliotis cracherodii]|uniref:uncharacterized protein n=1 Tax=Haliotis cracherodii TaxID=6455 RepID=UPI0039EA540E